MRKIGEMKCKKCNNDKSYAKSPPNSGGGYELLCAVCDEKEIKRRGRSDDMLGYGDIDNEKQETLRFIYHEIRK